MHICIAEIQVLLSTFPIIGWVWVRCVGVTQRILLVISSKGGV